MAEGDVDDELNEAVTDIAPRASDIYGSGNKPEFVEYRDPGRVDPIAFRFDGETQSIWATQAQIAALFEASQSTISYHLKRIFDEGELTPQGNIEKFDIARSTKPVALYSLDAVISVGYRVNSRAATRFRQWATETLKAYLQQGFVINDKALREHPEKLNALAAKSARFAPRRNRFMQRFGNVSRLELRITTRHRIRCALSTHSFKTSFCTQ